MQGVHTRLGSNGRTQEQVLDSDPHVISTNPSALQVGGSRWHVCCHLELVQLLLAAGSRAVLGCKQTNAA